MMSLHKIARFDLYCLDEENLLACDDEQSKVVGPIKSR